MKDIFGPGMTRCRVRNLIAGCARALGSLSIAYACLDPPPAHCITGGCRAPRLRNGLLHG